MPIVVGGGIFKSATAAVATTTWDPLNVSDGSTPTVVTLSNGNKTAEIVGAIAGGPAGRSVASISSGQKYCEITIVAAVPRTHIGILNGTPDVVHASVDIQSLGCGLDHSGNVGVLGAFPGVATAFVQNDVVCMAVDKTNNKIWFRTNGGNWNNDVIGNQDPANNIGGFDISGITGAIFAAFDFNIDNDKITANFGPTYAQTKPSGFGDW